MRTLRVGGLFPEDPFRGRFNKNRRNRIRSNASAGAASNASYWSRVQGWKGPVTSGMTSCVLSSVGDLLAQYLQSTNSKDDFSFDPIRTARMAAFGLLWYGTSTYYFFNLMEYLFPGRVLGNFLKKLAVSQLMFGPYILTSVFTWNLCLTGNAHLLPQKLKKDLVPSAIDGWKFWIPAGCLLFFFVPLKYQVLFQSSCGVLWTGYLSYSSSQRPAGAPAAAKPAALPAPAGKGK